MRLFVCFEPMCQSTTPKQNEQFIRTLPGLKTASFVLELVSASFLASAAAFFAAAFSAAALSAAAFSAAALSAAAFSCAAFLAALRQACGQYGKRRIRELGRTPQPRPAPSPAPSPAPQPAPWPRHRPSPEREPQPPPAPSSRQHCKASVVSTGAAGISDRDERLGSGLLLGLLLSSAVDERVSTESLKIAK